MAQQKKYRGDLKNQILRISRELLEQEGADAINMREIAKRAGVTPMASYTHFANKKAILNALAISGFEALETATSTALQHPGLSPEEELIAMGVAYIMHGVEHPRLYAMMFGSMKSREPDKAVRAAADSAYDVLRSRLKAHADHFGFLCEEMDMHALSCWSLAHGMTSLLTEGHVRTLGLRTLSQKRAAAENAVRVLIDGLRANRAAMAESRSS